MASIYEGTFDTEALQKELVNALEEDRKYKATDEMKKRAIHTAGSYDEFRNFVLCADLNPVTSKELQNLSKSQRQPNRLYKKKSQTRERVKLLNATDNFAIPKTSAEFLRNWKRNCSSNALKYEYLVLTTPERLGRLFQAEIEADLFVNIVDCMADSLTNLNPNNELDDYEREQERVGFAFAIFQAIGTTRRLGLMLSFLSPDQVEKLRKFLQTLETLLNQENEECVQGFQR
ncbi:hypothetical protein THRCLA_22237, partial [Thraustotheca clavata]